MGVDIFFSWQSDLNPKHHRFFIWDALDNARRALKKEWEVIGSVELENRENNYKEIVLRRGGTEGYPGTKNIVEAIFERIEEADIFIADVTIVNSKKRGIRKTSNPNVLFELGYAVKKLGWDRIILIANTAYGRVEDLPFDFRAMGITPYHLPVDYGCQMLEIPS